MTDVEQEQNTGNVTARMALITSPSAIKKTYIRAENAMRYLIIGGILGVGSVIWFWRWRSWQAKENQVRVADSEIDCKLAFIRDVCDGNLKKSNALLMEKMTLDSTLTYEQAVDLVYADMLELTADERNAIVQHANRRAA